MPERRMMTKKVTDDDHFLALSASAQALYLHLTMNADDDGFCNQVSISMFKAHASVQDLQALLENRYIYQFENGVIVIKHWRMANALRKDRYTPTAFQEELAKLHLKDNGVYTFPTETRLPDGCQMVAKCLPQDRLGKVRLNNSLPSGKESQLPAEDPPESADADPPLAEEIEVERQPAVPYKEIVELYHRLCPSYPRVTMLSEKRKAALRSRWKQYKSLEVFERLFRKAESSAFLKGQNGRNWSAKFDWLIADSNMVKVLDGNYDDGPGYEGRSRDRPGHKNPMIEGNLSEELDELEIRIAASKIKDPEARRQYLAKHQLE